MAKGFKDSKGKFRPTEKRSKSTITESDVRKDKMKNLEMDIKGAKNYGDTAHAKNLQKRLDDLKNRKKKSLNNEDIKINKMNFYTAENFDIKYSFDDEGKIVYKGGIGKALEKMGARKLTDKEIGVIIGRDDDTDVTEQDFYKNQKDAIFEYSREKQEDHSQNFLPATAEDYSFGTFKIKGREFFVLESMDNDEDDGIYDIDLIEDIEGLGDDNSGWYATRLINPEIIIEFERGGRRYEVRRANQKDGEYYDIESSDGGSVDSDVESVTSNGGELIDQAIEKFVNKK